MLKVQLNIEMIEDLRNDIKDDPELDFGNCAELECREKTCFGIHLSINKTTYVIYVCKKHKEKICKDFGKIKQEKLNV